MKSYRGLKLLPLTAMAVISIYVLGSVKGST